VISFPTNAPREVAYMVRDVQPRWLKFVNEHLMATLTRLSPEQFDDLVPDAPPEVESEQQVFFDVASDSDPDHPIWTEPGGLGEAITTIEGADSPTNGVFFNDSGPTFGIPVGATIVGMSVAFQKGATEIIPPGGGTGVTDFIVQVVVPGFASVNKASAVPWVDPGDTVTYGGPSDLWGLTLTPAIFNAASLAVVIAAQCSSGMYALKCGPVNVTVFYTV